MYDGRNIINCENNSMGRLRAGVPVTSMANLADLTNGVHALVRLVLRDLT